jgi:O-antigen/teichoic acid export membrane protein
MLVVMAKVGDPELVGRFVLGLAVTAPIFMLTNLQLRAVQAGDARHHHCFGDYLALRLLTTLSGLTAVALIAILGGYPPDSASVILGVGVAKAFESISDVLYGLLQQRERMDRIAGSMMIKGPFSLIALGTATYMTGSAAWGAAALALAWGLVLLGYDLPAARGVLQYERGESARPRWEFSALAILAKTAFPLGVVMMLISLNINVPRYFIESTLGARELGIFAAIAYIMSAGNTVVGALGQSATPRLARHFAEGNLSAYQSLVRKLLTIGVAFGSTEILLALLIGRPVLTWLYKPEYADRVDIFVWVMAVAAIANLASFLGYAITAARCFRPQVPLFGSCVVISAIACWALVPSQGLRGAAWAMLASYTVQFAGCLFIQDRLVRSLREGWTSS